MNVQFLEETAATSRDIPPELDQTALTSIRRQRSSGVLNLERPGLLIAGLVLSAGLTSPGAIGAVPVSYALRRRYETVTESGTTAFECQPEVLEQVRELFNQGASEFFEDGIHSVFSRRLLALVAIQGRVAFRAISEYLLTGDTDPDVVSEALRWLADFNDPTTLTDRWSILQRTLRDRSPRVRDGAILGFAALDDPRALPVLLEAREHERVAELRRLITQVIDQLNATAHGAPAAYRKGEPLA